eukprot:SAG22_NODE_809_length_7067_cov_5.261768_2_plen_469_part_00
MYDMHTVVQQLQTAAGPAAARPAAAARQTPRARPPFFWRLRPPQRLERMSGQHPSSSGAAAHVRRLQQVAAGAASGATAAASEAALPDVGSSPERPPAPALHDGGGGPPPPPQLLTDDQLQGYLANGFVALPVSELPQDWHAEFAAELADHRFGGTDEVQLDSNLVQHPKLTVLLSAPTVRGALSSILGPDFVQYPNRALQSYGKPDGRQEVRTTDDKWHKDQCYVPVRHHRTRWAIMFYYPVTVTREMGGTGVLPGSAYTTIDHDERAQDLVVDTCEDYLSTAERVAAKTDHFVRLARAGAFKHGGIDGAPAPADERPEAQAARQLAAIEGLGRAVETEGLGRATAVLVDSSHARPALRQAVERECERRLGVGLPRDLATRRLYGPLPAEEDTNSHPAGGDELEEPAGQEQEQEQEQEGLLDLAKGLADAPIQSGDFMPPDKYMTLPEAGYVRATFLLHCHHSASLL